MSTLMQLPSIPTTDLAAVTGGVDAGALGTQIGGFVDKLTGNTGKGSQIGGQIGGFVQQFLGGSGGGSE